MMGQQTHVVWPKWDPNRGTRATFLDMSQEASSREQRPYVSLDGYNTLMIRPRSPISMSKTRDWRSEAFRAYRPISDLCDLPAGPYRSISDCVSPVDQYSPTPLPRIRPEPPVSIERAVHAADPAKMVPRPGDEDRAAFFARMYATKSTYDRRAQKLKSRLEGWDKLTQRSAELSVESRERWERVKKERARAGGGLTKAESLRQLAKQRSAPALAR